MENTTSIEVLAKTTAENLRIKNEAFLAKYPTDDSQIDYYTELAQKVFDEFEIDGTHSKVGVRKNVEVWFANKKPQMELFRRHPYWNEEAKAIVFIQDELRTIDYNKAYHHLNSIGNYVCNKFKDDEWSQLHIGIYYALMEMHDCGSPETSTITEEFIRRFKNNISCDIPKDINRMLKVGTKITKFTHKCFTKWQRPNGDIINATTLVDDHAKDDRSYNSFDKMYAQFADALSELTIKKITLVSLHFCDFMLMSNGNSWSSCHYINSHNIFHDDSDSSYSGCYKQGCLSYALDAPSFLLYTLPASYDGEEYYRQQKMNRMCCQYEEGILVTGKCYPDNKDEKITRYRQILQLILSTIEDVPNLWTFSRKVKRVTAFVSTDCDATHYRDYESGGQKPTISMCKHRIDLDHTITIGHGAYCVDCGSYLHGCDEKWLQCERHRKKPICECCGRRLAEDEKIMWDGHIYCSDCVFWCGHHDRYELKRNGQNPIQLADRGEINVCDNALAYYFYCDGCGKWHHITEAHYSNNGRCCNDCYHELKAKGEWHVTLDMVNCDHYQAGDYVLIVDDVSVCEYGYNAEMQEQQGRIARILRSHKSFGRNTDVYGLYNVSWSWSNNCFVGKIIGDVNDSMLGKTWKEALS